VRNNVNYSHKISFQPTISLEFFENLAMELYSKLVLTMSLHKKLQELTVNLSELPLQALLAAAFIAYLSGLAEEHRRTVLEHWRERLGLENFSLRQFLASEQELLVWQGQGLPADNLSIENAITIIQVINIHLGCKIL
jgi:hypothetical protein